MLENRSLKRDLLALALLAAVIFLAAALFTLRPGRSARQACFSAAQPPGERLRLLGAVVSRLLSRGGRHRSILRVGFAGGIRRGSAPAADTNHLWLRRSDGALLAGFTTLAALAVPWLSPGPVIGAGGYLGVTGRRCCKRTSPASAPIF